MGQFSDDGKWWWDGQAWVATSQVVLPTFPPTESELSGNLQVARRRLLNRGWLYWLDDAGCALAWLRLPFMVPLVPAWSTYRKWTLEQLGLATSYLLGKDEIIVAAEANLDPSDALGGVHRRDPAVVVTARHVLIFRIDSFDEQPRWIALAARPSEVKMESRWIFESGTFRQALVVTNETGRWVIGKLHGASRLDDVVDAWRRAAQGTAKTG